MRTTTLTIAGVCLTDRAGRLLTVRKRGATRFMLPGGKLEPGETAIQAAIREVDEEVGIALSAADLRLLGTWMAPAANEPDTDIDSTVYTAEVGLPEPSIAREIDELRWLDLSGATAYDDLAPLLDLQVIPALQRRR